MHVGVINSSAVIQKDKVSIPNHRFCFMLPLLSVCAIFVFCKLNICLKERDFQFVEDSQSNVTTVLSRFLENGILCRGVEADCICSKKENAVKLTTNEKLFSFSQNQSRCLIVRFF